MMLTKYMKKGEIAMTFKLFISEGNLFFNKIVPGTSLHEMDAILL